MKEHFNLRSVIFYASAIGSVVVLFTVATAYGEKNLQAPRPIDGRYSLTLQSPSDCLQAKPVNLFLQQSGVFLTGSILPADAADAVLRIARERPPLSGQWRDDQLTLTGKLDRAWNCPATVKIAGTLSGSTLQGTLTLSVIPTPIPFTGDREVIQSTPKSH